MIRLLDIVLASVGLLFTWPIMLVICIVSLFDTGSPIFIQTRVGRYQKPFTLIKFRTMRVDTASVASHLADRASITRFGSFLRRTKLDELPQLINVWFGSMSFVGPRPNLYNQTELIEARSQLGVYDARPGITGLAQILEIDMSTPQKLAETDARMLSSMSLGRYFTYIIKTALGAGAGDRIK
ncbi:MAG: sugar transferase [Oceanospirillaceae bacterium]|nr:sugar transferase [Oceanospirillaceae bacterium]